MHAGGRPSKYSPELAELACEVIETTPGSLDLIFAERDDLPTFRTILNWECDHPEFFRRLSRAREIRAHIMAESAIAIADESDHDTITKTGKNGEEYEAPNSEWMARSRLRFEARRWAAKNLNQRFYGERSAVDLGGQDGNPLRTESTSLRITASDLPVEDREAIQKAAHRLMQGAK